MAVLRNILIIFLGIVLFVFIFQLYGIVHSKFEDAFMNFNYVESDTLKSNEYQHSNIWTYNCIDQICKRVLLPKYENENETEYKSNLTSLDICWLSCGNFSTLWPAPQFIKTFDKKLTPFSYKNVEIKFIEKLNDIQIENFVNNITDLFKARLKLLEEFDINTKSSRKVINLFNNNIFILLNLDIKHDQILKLNLETDESYELTIIQSFEKSERFTVNVQLNAFTVFGLRHGFESLYQLIEYDEYENCLKILSDLLIKDKPSFPYRGVMIDTARNFIPIKKLENLIEAMSHNKLNVLHLHLSDSNSFPFFSKRVPQMTMYGAYSSGKIYWPEDLKALKVYANLRGIKIIPEIDAPAHAGNGWQWGNEHQLGNLSFCFNKEPWHRYCGQPPCGQLNPANNNTYEILEKIYQDIFDIFDNDVFHMGGDEVYDTCWRLDDEVNKWIRENNKYGNGVMEVWSIFQSRALSKLVDGSNNETITPIVWTSGLTSNRNSKVYLPPSTYVIQVWEPMMSFNFAKILNEGYKVILSNVDYLYLDQGFGSWLGTRHIYQYIYWQKIYDFNLDLVKLRKSTMFRISSNVTNEQVLGAEVPLWTEKVDEMNLDMKIWPRTAAFAERLWTNPQTKRNNIVYSRLNHHRKRMIERFQISADILQPESCLQLLGNCDDQAAPI